MGRNDIIKQNGMIDWDKIGGMNDDIKNLGSQMAEKAKQTDLDSTNANIGDRTQLNTDDKSSIVNAIKEVKTQVNIKANQSALDATNSTVALKADTNYVDTKVASVASGAPDKTFATLTALQTAYPTGDSKNKLVSADGHIYNWNGSAWVDTGIQYQSTGIADDSITISMLKQLSPQLLISSNAKFTIPSDTTINSKVISCSTQFLAVNTSLGTFYNIPAGEITDKTIPDGSVLELVWDGTSKENGTDLDFKIEAFMGAIFNNQKYILFYNLGGKLISPIPSLQIQLDKIYNPITNIDRKILPEPLSKIIPVNCNISITPGTSAVDTETVTIPNGSIFMSTTKEYSVQGTQLNVDIPDGSLLYLQWDDTNTIYPSLPDGSFVAQPVLDFVPAWNKHILFMNESGKLISPIPSLQIQLDKIYNGVKLGYKNVIIVAKQGGDYDTLNNAYNYALTIQSADNPVTIVVMPGIYKEVLNVYGDKNISIVGINKLTCILRYDSGQYAETPLRIEGSAYIANMTIISTHNDDSTTPVDQLRAYAVHCDDVGPGTTEIFNCILISYQNAALGCGLHQDQKLKVTNCEIISHTPADSSMRGNGALFCHSNTTAGTSNQDLIVKNCIIKSDLSYAAYINDANKTAGNGAGTIMNATFYNNMFFSNELKKTGIINTDIKTTGNLSGSINLTSDSYGNNISELNV